MILNTSEVLQPLISAQLSIFLIFGYPKVFAELQANQIKIEFIEIEHIKVYQNT